jgi:hypothetical protein
MIKALFTVIGILFLCAGIPLIIETILENRRIKKLNENSKRRKKDD